MNAQKINIAGLNSELLAGVEPEALWRHFLTLCTIPRSSGHEKEVTDYIQKLANKRHLKTTRDSLHNLLVRVPASEGYERLPVTCLQSHTDMVCEKNSDIAEMFPIKLTTKKGRLCATGTTLGADNGIGVAAMMAFISETDLKHGPLELVFTTQEEIGLEGAKAFDYSQLDCKRVFNLDSEEKNIIYIGCAGGARVTATFQPVFVDPGNETTHKFSINVRGFTGGHSGAEIHLKRGNAIRVLAALLSEMKVGLVEFTGGGAMNAIPREATATVMVSKENAGTITAAIMKLDNSKYGHFPKENPSFLMTEMEVTGAEEVFDADSQQKFLALLLELPDGVISMEPQDTDMVRSSNNIGSVTMNKGAVLITGLYRSSIEVEMDAIERRIEAIFKKAGARCEVSSKYSPWEPYYHSVLLKEALIKHKEATGKDADVKVVHAGLECAYFHTNIPRAEVISFGPEIHDAHTPEESVNTVSVLWFWHFLLALVVMD